MAAEQVEAVQPAGAEVEEVVADKGYHSDATLVALDEIGVRSYVSEPERGRRCWQDKKTGETPAEKRAAQKALYGNRRRIRGDRGRRLLRRRGELVERPFAHQYETGGLRRVWVRGHENVRKRVLIQAAGCNLGLLAAPADRRRHAPEPAGAGSFGHLRTDRSPDRALGASDGLLGLPMDAGGAGRLNRSSPSCLNRPAQRTAFFHGLLAMTMWPAARSRSGLVGRPTSAPTEPARRRSRNGDELGAARQPPSSHLLDSGSNPHPYLFQEGPKSPAKFLHLTQQRHQVLRNFIRPVAIHYSPIG